MPSIARAVTFILASFFTFLFSCTPGEVSPPELIRVPYTSHEQEQRNFFLYLPEGYRNHPEQKWPVILFLHGNGERGNGREDLDWVLKEGLPYEVWIQKRNLPFIIIAPQLPMYGMDSLAWIHDRDVSMIPKRRITGVPDRPEEFSTPDTMGPVPGIINFPPMTPKLGWEKSETDLIAIVDTVIHNYHGDADRVYLTGLSYGGYGTWYMAGKHPDVWAAIAPVSGWGHPESMKPIADHQLPVWAFAGGRDQTVNLGYYYAEINKLEELGDKEVRFTIEEDMGHDTWRRVYAGEDLYTWFLSHKKGK